MIRLNAVNTEKLKEGEEEKQDMWWITAPWQGSQSENVLVNNLYCPDRARKSEEDIPGEDQTRVCDTRVLKGGLEGLLVVAIKPMH